MENTELKNKIENYKNEFAKIFNTQIVPELAELEKSRKSELSIMIYNELILIAVFVGSLVLNFSLAGHLPETLYAFLFLISLLLFIAAIIFPTAINQAFCRKIKSVCFPKLLKIPGNLNWDTDESKINIENIKESNLFAGFDEHIIDDCFCGEYSSVTLKINETVLQSGQGKGRLPFKSFKGVIIDVKFNKTINNNTLIYSVNDLQIYGATSKYLIAAVIILMLFSLILDCIGLVFNSPEFWACFLIAAFFVISGFINLTSGIKKKFQIKNLEEIKLEDPEFSKKFKAYSSDQTEGRYLITTAFMERFKNIKTSFKSADVKCSFYKNHLMFAIASDKNVFETGNIFSPINNSKNFETFFDELISILLFVDYFKLNEKTGL